MSGQALISSKLWDSMLLSGFGGVEKIIDWRKHFKPSRINWNAFFIVLTFLTCQIAEFLICRIHQKNLAGHVDIWRANQDYLFYLDIRKYILMYLKIRQSFKI